ncbi:4-hydroxy-tetrahydrodipicolinate reductase [Pseudonocardia pini]|uniref:4-hydroxy-tetrahydrodipicolinate reductase n=1 Tax=Pseudonocardia pini TaxID=2758030 RepID=UPI0015F0F401|nr:4-hydroxy-tetrahydrodipicolinate reductase [Pseudonocardia pini]
MIRVAVLGAKGRMGSEACAAVRGAEDLELVAEIGSGDPIADIAPADVVVDLTRPDVVMDNLRYVLGEGKHAVVGVSGFDEERLGAVRGMLAGTDLGVLVAPNFGVGAVLTMHFAAIAAPFFESVEIVEAHHEKKVDAPSGTAARTATLVAQARAKAGLGPVPDATTSDPDGARGAVVDGIHVHAVRMPGVVAQQDVILGEAGETLTISHNSANRASFMPGVLMAIRAVPQRPGLTFGLEPLLGL